MKSVLLSEGERERKTNHRMRRVQFYNFCYLPLYLRVLVISAFWEAEPWDGVTAGVISIVLKSLKR